MGENRVFFFASAICFLSSRSFFAYSMCDFLSWIALSCASVINVDWFARASNETMAEFVGEIGSAVSCFIIAKEVHCVVLLFLCSMQ
jgi:hypothetical protein